MHERSTFLMWQSATQTVFAAVFIICASPIAGAIGPGNWHTLGAGLCAVTFFASIIWVPESRYDRSLAAYGQFSADEGGEFDGTSRATAVQPVRLSERPALDTTRFLPRTMWSDMRLFVDKPDWKEGVYGFINTFQVMLFPNVLWAFCLNGLTIGVNIAIGTTSATSCTHLHTTGRTAPFRMSMPAKSSSPLLHSHFWAMAAMPSSSGVPGVTAVFTSLRTDSCYSGSLCLSDALLLHFTA
jgi:hypothetical protein